MFPKLIDLLDVFNDEKKCLELLLQNEAIDAVNSCHVCQGSVALHDKNYRCTRRNCRKRISAVRNSFFANSRLECREVLLIGYLWLTGCSTSTIIALTGHSKPTITDYLGHYRDLIAGCLENEDVMVGGENVFVEIDESKFAKRKNNRGHAVEGCWVVGGVERTTERRIFIEVVPDRTRETLINVISRHVLPGSIVLTDLWRGYLGLEDILGVQHRTVNHSLSFRNPVNDTHTNTIEGTWCGIKRKIPIRNRNSDTIDRHLMEFIWRRKNQENLWLGLMKAFKETWFD